MNTHSDFEAQGEPVIAPSLQPTEFANFEDAVAWMMSQNPNFETNHPEDLDWQAIKSAARRS